MSLVKGIPNWSFEEMFKEGEMSLLERDSWTSIVGKMYPTDEELKDTEELVRKLKVNNKVLVLSLSNALETFALDKMLSMKGKAVILNHKSKSCTINNKERELLNKVLENKGTILYPYEMTPIEKLKKEGKSLREANKIHFQRIMESYLIRARLSDTIIHVGNIQEPINGLERFALGYGKLLAKNIFSYHKDIFHEEQDIDLCHIYWDIEYEPLRKYIIRKKF